MKIVGVDLHARQQSIAMLDTETGEWTGMVIRHEGNAVREVYGALEGPVVDEIYWSCLTTVVLIAPAYADAAFHPGNHPQPHEQNVLFLTAQMGTNDLRTD